MSQSAVEQASMGQPLSSSLSDNPIVVSPFDDTFAQIDLSSISSVSPDQIPDIPFFMGGDRRSVLDELMHLCQFSQSIVAVLGEAGVGKTALAYQAVVELSETANCCVLSSSVMLSEMDVLNQLVDQLGVFVPDTASADEILMVLGQYQPVGLHSRVVIVVDDAHHLSDSVLSLFLKLLQQQASGALQVLLVGDSSLLVRLDELERGDVLVYDIPLCPFKVDELEHYLAFKLASVGYLGGEIFDEELVQKIWKDTRGIPASVNRFAHQLLLSHTSEPDEASKLGLPMTYMAVLVLLLAALIMAIFYVGDEPSEAVIDEPIAEIQPSTSVPPKPEVGGALPLAEPQQTEKLEEPLVAGETALEKRLDQLIEEKQLADNSEPDQSAVVSEPLEAVADNTPTDKVVAEKPVEQKLEPELVKQELKSQVDAQVPVVEPKPVKPQEKPVAVSPPSSARSADEDAVMFWPKEAYTLQVMGAGQLSGIEQFIQRQPNRRLLRVVTFERNQKPWYVVLVGVYQSLDEARAAIKNLPQSQRSAKPWPRKVSDVQGKIDGFRRR